ncbi:MAG: sterol desaturase family protein [Chlorogloeopsis fritschii C42_A2020_084]|uniref:sterol desaturase family protein n=2 Tax=Chlorogloeopsis fritschii TaxID=1124 RepID=UPI0002F9104D|nr:sterol desaturase family protein [Chlorogloeopsis fritschii]MBF2009075.1 sterol desaturase family protein [Chlorogloeopsis fritschii C42_A2020_084]
MLPSLQGGNFTLMNHSFWFYLFVLFGLIVARYFLIAGGAYLLFYSLLGKSLAKRSLRRKPPMIQSILKDIELSVLSAVVFAVCAALILCEYDLGVTLLYTDWREYGLWYLGVSFILVLILQDTYFYFIHRMFHHPSLFKWMHYGHHRSGDSTPWTSFAFDFPEAIIQALFFVGVVFIVPLHFITLVAVLVTMTVWAVLNHLGFEVFSSSFKSHWFGKWLIGPMHHSIHHRKYTVHYGLYFTFWDKLFGTQIPDYEDIAESVITNTTGIENEIF